MSTLKRLLELIPAAGRQMVPLGGIFGLGWLPTSAIGVYWLESVLLALIAVIWCRRLQRRTSDQAIHALRLAGDTAGAAALAAEQQAVRTAGVDPRAVLSFHLPSLAMFGLFIAGILFIASQNGLLERPLDWNEFRDGATAMLIVIAIGFGIEQIFFPATSVDDVRARVDACTGRWALLWLLGFFGTGLMLYTGRGDTFISFFAVLKVTQETWGGLARIFGWDTANA